MRTKAITYSLAVLLVAGLAACTDTGGASTNDQITSDTASTTLTAVETSPVSVDAATAPADPSPTPGEAAAATPPPDGPPSPDQAPGETGPGGEMTLTNSLSDQAQGTTIAFSALAFMTGSLCTDSFFPPGKVSDFFGFQYLRDNEPDAYGHNTAFAATVGENVLFVLDQDQVDLLVELAESQTSDINEYGYARFTIMDAFRRLLDDDLPEGTSNLSEDAVSSYSAGVYRLDGEISYNRAAVFAEILNGLTDEQADDMAALAATDVVDWPDRSSESAVERWRQLEPDTHVALMTVAGQLFSWYAGDVDADTYFCPERHGTYFGSFYLKDIPAMLSQWAGTDVTINENLTGEYGQMFLEVLTVEQRAVIEDLTEQQRIVIDELVATRQVIAAELRRLWEEPGVDPSAVESEVLALSERYGELDGLLVTMYVTAFDEVYERLTDDQIATLWSYRTNAEYLGLIEDPCGLSKGDLAYLYSQAIKMPETGSTDGFFE